MGAHNTKRAFEYAYMFAAILALHFCCSAVNLSLSAEQHNYHLSLAELPQWMPVDRHLSTTARKLSLG